MKNFSTPTFLTKFPVSITEKKHSIENPRTGNTIHYDSEISHAFATKYGYFDVDRKNNVTFIITLVDRTNEINYTIKVAKQYIYDSLMLFLQYRPVERKPWRTKNFYVHNNIGPLIPEAEMNKLTPPEIKERYMLAKGKLENFINDTPDETRKRTAELQLERMIIQQWKMELLHSIYVAEQIADSEDIA